MFGQNLIDRSCKRYHLPADLAQYGQPFRLHKAATGHVGLEEIQMLAAFAKLAGPADTCR